MRVCLLSRTHHPIRSRATKPNHVPRTDVIGIEQHTANVFVQDNYSLGRCRSVFAMLDAAALDATQSRDLLTQILAEDHAARTERGTAAGAPSEWLG
ncbi:Scr1 family TA system antitoxin-like transcriptional regulator [Lentzea sp. NPDC005914]|uniref:Scr1 family TA system antitoxin-like transcriptional regulator n=1 Tax=Lentzea sp. NPDC005914 TaxID=3154572 RepID=UPI0033E0AC97